MAVPPKKKPTNPKFQSVPTKVKSPTAPQSSNLTPPNATGVKKTKPKKKKGGGSVGVGSGKNGMYW